MASTSYRDMTPEWNEAGIDDIISKHEITCCNCEPDGFDTEMGDWWLADDDTLTIVYGTFSNSHSPGTMGSAERYDNKLEYIQAVKEWEAQPEYVDLDEEENADICSKCGAYCNPDTGDCDKCDEEEDICCFCHSSICCCGDSEISIYKR